MLSSMLDSLFGCAHRRTTFPLTPGRRGGYSSEVIETRGKTYVACLDCGREFDYDWKSMRIGQQVQVPASASHTQTMAAHN